MNFSGYDKHTEPETDSDGDGGTTPKLGGLGYMEFSGKGIPHGSLHFPEQLKWAGHVYMHDTCAPEASHRLNIKKAMDRVRKLDDTYTSASMTDWMLRIRAWGKIIRDVKRDTQPCCSRKTNTKKRPRRIRVTNARTKIIRPTMDIHNLFHSDTFSPLRAGGENLTSQDARVSYNEVIIYVHPYMCTHICPLHIVNHICNTYMVHEHTFLYDSKHDVSHIRFMQLASLISKKMNWDIDYVKDVLEVCLFCSAQVMYPCGDTRTYWATESRYSYNRGKRRDMVEVDLGNGRLGVAQITAFITMERLPEHVKKKTRRESVLIRWMSESSQSPAKDDQNRPLCGYPLCSNHCLWTWATVKTDRQCFKRRGFRKIVERQEIWSHINSQQRADAQNKEIRAWYDIIDYSSIVGFANIAEDPTTGHFLQTLQIL